MNITLKLTDEQADILHAAFLNGELKAHGFVDVNEISRPLVEPDIKAAESAAASRLLLTSLMSINTTKIPLTAATRDSVLQELVSVLEQSSQVYDPKKILQELVKREQSSPTSLPCGVAIPHPRYWPDKDIVVYGKTAAPIAFGPPKEPMTDIFFLVCCRRSLPVQACLARLLLRCPSFLEDLRATNSASETLTIIKRYEHDMVVSRNEESNLVQTN